jgi:hypothetical protein
MTLPEKEAAPESMGASSHSKVNDISIVRIAQNVRLNLFKNVPPKINWK